MSNSESHRTWENSPASAWFENEQEYVEIMEAAFSVERIQEMYLSLSKNHFMPLQTTGLGEGLEVVYANQKLSGIQRFEIGILPYLPYLESEHPGLLNYFFSLAFDGVVTPDQAERVKKFIVVVQFQQLARN